MQITCSGCHKANETADWEISLTEAAQLTCPVCGTIMVLDAKLKEPVMKTDTMGAPGMGAPPPVPEAPAPAPAEGGEQQMAAGASDDYSNLIELTLNGTCSVDEFIAVVTDKAVGSLINLGEEEYELAETNGDWKLVVSEHQMAVLDARENPVFLISGVDGVNEWCDFTIVEFPVENLEEQVVSVIQKCSIQKARHIFEAYGFTTWDRHLSSIVENSHAECPDKPWETLVDKLFEYEDDEDGDEFDSYPNDYEDDEGLEVQCPACGAVQPEREAMLGAMGNTVHYRCRYCGVGFSQRFNQVESVVVEGKRDIKVGTKVKYATKWLRSTGQYTGDIPFARGVVTELRQYGPSLTIAVVDWKNEDVPGKVNVKNLMPVGVDDYVEAEENDEKPFDSEKTDDFEPKSDISDKTDAKPAKKAPEGPKTEIPVIEDPTWKGSLASFNTKLQALFGALAVDCDLGHVVQALSDGNALSIKGEEIELNLPRMKTSLVKFLQDNETKTDVTEAVGIGGALAVPPVDGTGEGDEDMQADGIEAGVPGPLDTELPTDDALGGPGIDTALPDTTDPEPIDVPTIDWAQRLDDELPKYF